MIIEDAIANKVALIERYVARVCPFPSDSASRFSICVGAYKAAI